MTPPGFNLRAGGLIVARLELEANDDAFRRGKQRHHLLLHGNQRNKESNFHTFQKPVISYCGACDAARLQFSFLQLPFDKKESIISRPHFQHDSNFSKHSHFLKFARFARLMVFKYSKSDPLKVTFNNVCVSQRRLRESFKKLARALGVSFSLCTLAWGLSCEVMTSSKGQLEKQIFVSPLTATLSVKFRFQWGHKKRHLRL